MNKPLVVAAGLAMLQGTACTNFDREDRIEDMRVLAMKAEPAEVLFSPLFLTPASQRPPGFPLPTVDVRMEAFAFDPRGGRTEVTTQLCPEGAGDSTCRLYDVEADLAAEPAENRDELRALLTPVKTQDEVTADELPLGRVSPAVRTFTFSPAVIDFFIPDDADGNPVPSIFPELPRVVYEAKNLDVVDEDPNDDVPPVTKERAFKRIPVGLDLTSSNLPPDVAADFARAFGFELCTAPISEAEYEEQGRASCLERRVPNANPGLRGFFLEADPEDITKGLLTTNDVPPDLGLGSLLIANPGDRVTVTPVFMPGSEERYQVVSFDIEASKVILLNRIEDIVCEWYSTRGDVSSTQTALQFNDGLGVTWQLPSDAKSGEKDTMLLVVLDQRGGTAVAEITVEYR
jgi:hypothetical protein